MAQEYKKEIKERCELQLEKICGELPEFVSDYLLKYLTGMPRTKLAYGYEIQYFFRYLVTVRGLTGTKDITPEYLESLQLADITEYRSHLEKAGNAESAVSRKLTALRGFWKWMISSDLVNNNPMLLIKGPKIPKKNVIAMSSDEVKNVLSGLETGDIYDEVFAKNEEKRKKLPVAQQKNYRPALKDGAKKRSEDLKLNKRDDAIITLLLATGLRVSELVGIDLEDVDFRDRSIAVVRKGGDEGKVFFNEYTEGKLKDYLKERKIPKDGSSALFVSAKYSRLSVRSVERLVEKYVDPLAEKHISTHKLRATYATNLYNASRDIYKVSKALNHSSTAATVKYAELSDGILKEAADSIDYMPGETDGKNKKQEDK